jgi:hypothetical protein
MTMPDERARALRFAGEILREMRSRPDVPDDLRQQAQFILRHYPAPPDLERMIHDVDRMPREFLDQHWLAPEVAITTGARSAGETS